MELEIKINDRLLKVKLIERNNNKVKVLVDDKIYDIDIVKACENNYSVINQGKSHVIDIAKIGNPNKYMASTYFNNYDIQIIDSVTKAKEQRKGSFKELELKTISSPMPGSVVKILVNVGDEVKVGQTLIVVEAMKMQSEYKSTLNTTVKKINVLEKDTILAGQVLIELN